MELNFICYKKCSTCKKAEKFLRNHGQLFKTRDYVDEPLNESEITRLYQKSGLPFEKFLNTSGIPYRELNMKEKRQTLSEQEIIKLMAEHPKLIKRPILETETTATTGFNETAWTELIAKKKGTA